MVLLGLPVIYLLLLTPWDGKSTWFGNVIHGRQGNAHTPANPTLFDSWWFLAIRNPISNFGKLTLSNTRPDAWLVDKRLGRFGILYGWKNADPRIGNRRPFLFRPYIK
jgi:hypothetical protein